MDHGRIVDVFQPDMGLWKIFYFARKKIGGIAGVKACSFMFETADYGSKIAILCLSVVIEYYHVWKISGHDQTCNGVNDRRPFRLPLREAFLRVVRDMGAA